MGRTRAKFSVKSDQTTALEDYSGAIGVEVVSDQAVAVGVTAVPTPVGQSSSDVWIAFEWFMGKFVFVSGVGFEDGNSERVLESKAMRKVQEGEQLITVVESSALSTGFTLQVAQRILVKLH